MLLIPGGAEWHSILHLPIESVDAKDTGGWQGDFLICKYRWRTVIPHETSNGRSENI
jgi:hypothetical protein